MACDLGRERSGDGVVLAVEDQVGVDLVRHQQGAVFDADLGHPAQVGGVPDDAQRIVGVAQQEDAALFGLGGKVVEINVPMAVFLHQLVFHHGAVPCFHHVVELGVDRRLDQDLVPVLAEQLDDGRQAGHHAQTPAHEGGVGLPAVALDLPFLHGLKVAGRAGGVAPDALLGFGLAGVDDGLGGAEIHIRHPQGDDVGGAELFDPLIVFGRTVVAAVDDLIKIVLHTRLLCLGWTLGQALPAAAGVSFAVVLLYPNPVRLSNGAKFIWRKHFGTEVSSKWNPPLFSKHKSRIMEKSPKTHFLCIYWKLHSLHKRKE